MKLSSAEASDLTNVMVDFSVAPATTDGPTGQKVTRWNDPEYEKKFGYYTDEKAIN